MTVLPPASDWGLSYNYDALNAGWNTKRVVVAPVLYERTAPCLFTEVLTVLGCIQMHLVFCFSVLSKLKHTQYRGFYFHRASLCVTSLDYLLPTRKGSNEVFYPIPSPLKMKFHLSLVSNKTHCLFVCVTFSGEVPVCFLPPQLPLKCHAGLAGSCTMGRHK
jgi:hypothetical protein